MSPEMLELFSTAIPVITFILGAGLTLVTDWLRDSRAYHISRKRYALEFQVKNYLELQDALQEMGRCAGRVLLHEASLTHNRPDLDHAAGEALRVAVSRVVVCQQRVSRACVRAQVNHARIKIAEFAIPNGYTRETEIAFYSASEALTKAQDSVGAALRSLMG